MIALHDCLHDSLVDRVFCTNWRTTTAPEVVSEGSEAGVVVVHDAAEQNWFFVLVADADATTERCGILYTYYEQVAICSFGVSVESQAG
jgi:hypothetical protein